MRQEYSSIRLVTPEGVEVHLYAASLPQRLYAYLLDFVLAEVAVSVVCACLPFRFLSLLVGILLSFLLPILYMLLSQWFWKGQSLGKKLLHIQVIDASGGKLMFSQLLVRELFRVIWSPIRWS